MTEYIKWQVFDDAYGFEELPNYAVGRPSMFEGLNDFFTRDLTELLVNGFMILSELTETIAIARETEAKRPSKNIAGAQTFAHRAFVDELAIYARDRMLGTPTKEMDDSGWTLHRLKRLALWLALPTETNRPGIHFMWPRELLPENMEPA
jgi:hypothetical protein